MASYYRSDVPIDVATSEDRAREAAETLDQKLKQMQMRADSSRDPLMIAAVYDALERIRQRCSKSGGEFVSAFARNVLNAGAKYGSLWQYLQYSAVPKHRHRY